MPLPAIQPPVDPAPSQSVETPNRSIEVELPAVEALVAATLALMTGYCQALQAAQHPQQRVLMGSKIARNLLQLADHPQPSAGFGAIVRGLQQRWVLMTACTADSDPARRGPCSALH